ncbi:MAG: DNA gyrase inhibitor YacG [Planctomycetaceae bacterium]|nr:DNA gyrase inhibitor YacG [Planctomycetaceae bacterium]
MIKPLTCPVCNKALPPQMTQSSPTFPFCSDRCRNVDLFRWGEGKYAIVEDLAERPDLLQEILEDDVFTQVDENEEDESY